jgi:hypothetical protein
MSDIDNELLAKFEGRWKEWKPSDPVDDLYNVDYDSLNPSYSTSPADRERLLEYLMGQEEMWMQFYIWSHEKKEQGDCNRVIYDWPFVSWLFSPLDGVPRWVPLLSDWLGMEEVREKFGTTECPCPPEFKGDEEINRVCPYCSGSGKIREEWAKEG